MLEKLKELGFRTFPEKENPSKGNISYKKTYVGTYDLDKENAGIILTIQPQYGDYAVEMEMATINIFKENNFPYELKKDSIKRLEEEIKVKKNLIKRIQEI